jgi:hypothetical protein
MVSAHGTHHTTIQCHPQLIPQTWMGSTMLTTLKPTLVTTHLCSNLNIINGTIRVIFSSNHEDTTKRNTPSSIKSSSAYPSKNTHKTPIKNSTRNTKNKSRRTAQRRYQRDKTKKCSQILQISQKHLQRTKRNCITQYGFCPNPQCRSKRTSIQL